MEGYCIVSTNTASISNTVPNALYAYSTVGLTLHDSLGLLGTLWDSLGLQVTSSGRGRPRVGELLEAR
jgi:hypothetical protein